MVLKRDYAAHDELYKRLRAEGESGWSTEVHIQEKIKEGLSKHAPKSGRLLELGCGDGELSLRLAERGFEVYGVDISSTAIEWAKEKAGERNLPVDFSVGNVLDLKEYQDEFFDFVFDGSCSHCIIGEDRKSFLVSVYRVLKKGGFFHVRTICGDPWDEETLKTFDKESRCLMRAGDIAYRYTGLPHDILEEIKTAGFHIVEWETGKGSTDPQHHGYGFNRLLVAAVKE
jgi:ubiquinone/menaquinone biosynthesis C-methylase UbiE